LHSWIATEEEALIEGAGEDRTVAVKRQLAFVRPDRAFSEMTDDELRAWIESVQASVAQAICQDGMSTKSGEGEPTY